MLVEGLSEETVDTIQQAMQLIAIGERNRKVRRCERKPAGRLHWGHVCCLLRTLFNQA